MHEMAICQSLAKIAVDHASRNGARRISCVRVEVGALSCVEPASLEFCFDAVTRGTMAHGARLEITVTPGEAWCWDCEAVFPATDRLAPCPHCQGVRLRIQGGDALRVCDLEVS